ncbi:MAG: ABC transporter ATP-binding protein [Alphaproteobacteria bacterium]|nr:MAG: ABC transporter ATP-binding protein [Alphaproteobacteria bacterium]
MSSALPILALRDARLAFGDKLLFEGLTLFLGRGDRIALVGANGTGKSTLLKCLGGVIDLDSGVRFVRPGTTIAWVPQEIEVPEGQSVNEFVSRADQARDGLKAEKAALAPHRVEAALARVGLDPTLQGGNLSGGEHRRAALARALGRDPDVLLLDEPTNHLDLAAIEWLELVLRGFSGAVLVISHDRVFLDNVSTSTLWLQRRALLAMNGRFSGFEEWSEGILNQEMKTAERLNKRIARETRWLHRGVTARRKRNQGRLRKLEEMREARRQRSLGRSTVSMTAAEGPPASQMVADLRRVSKSFTGADGTEIVLIRDFTTRIMRGDRVGLLGANGSGKTTLLRLILGELVPDQGHVRLGRRTEIAYFDQGRRDIDLAATPWQFLCPQGGDQINVRGHLRHVVGYLKEFLFDEDDVKSAIGTLSGGQRNRLMLAKVLAQPSNLLVLDEPTNDLDMDTLDKLLETLDAYDGTLIVVSHDRDFVDKLVTSLIVLEGGGVVEEYIGGYGDYLRQRRPGGVARGASNPAKKKAGPGARQARGRQAAPRKLGYHDQRELDGLPDRMAALEGEIAGLKARLAAADFFTLDAEGFGRSAARLEAAKEQLDAAEQRWLELETLAESLAGGVES